MNLVTPDIGLVFWMFLSFSFLLFILKKYAWKPILSALNERNTFIQNAIDTAQKTREEMTKLKADNETIIADAKTQRDLILKEAREIKDKMIAEAKNQAVTDANKITASARENIQHEKMAAITDLKNQVAHLSIEIAEKILKSELSEKDKQKAVVKNLLEGVKMN